MIHGLMLIAQHAWEVALFFTILAGPLPFVLSIYGMSLSGIEPENKFKQQSFAHCALILITSWSITEICIGLSLGALQQLHLNAVIGVEIFLFTAGLFWLVFCDRTGSERLKSGFQFTWKFARLELLIISSMSFVGFILLQNLATQPITNYDSLWFHLPAIARWYQTGSFTLLDPLGNWIFEHPDATSYPYNWHVLSVLFVMPFREDFLVALPMLIAWILLGLAVYRVSTHWGATRFYSMAAASLVLTLPMLLNQVNTIHIDLPLATFFTVSLYFAFSYHRTRSPIELALLLASLGLLIGIKTPGLIYAGLPSGILLVLEARRFWSRKSGSPRFQVRLNPWVLIGVGLLLFLGGFWYVKNSRELQIGWIELLGSQYASASLDAIPKLPDLQTLYRKLFDLQKSTLTHQFNPFELTHWKTVGIQAIVRLQLPFFVLLLQSALLPYALIDQKHVNQKHLDQKHVSQKHKKIRLICWAILLLVTGFLYWNTPYSSGTGGRVPGELSPILGFNMRYGFPAVALLGVMAALTATAVKTPRAIATLTVLLSGGLGVLSNSIFDAIKVQQLVGDRPFWASALLADVAESPAKNLSLIANMLGGSLRPLGMHLAIFLVSIGLAVWVLSRQSSDLKLLTRCFESLRRNYRTAAVAACIALLILSTWTAREIRDVHRAEIYRGIYDYLDEQVEPDQTIASFGSIRSYLFYGKHLDRSVVSIPLDPEWPSPAIDRLCQAQIDWVGIGPVASRWQQFQQFMNFAVHNGSLSPVLGDDVGREPVLYRVRTLCSKPPG